jgi:hypothetical protein
MTQFRNVEDFIIRSMSSSMPGGGTMNPEVSAIDEDSNATGVDGNQADDSLFKRYPAAAGVGVVDVGMLAVAT